MGESAAVDARARAGLVHRRVRELAAERGDALAVCDETHELSYAALDARADALAACLRGLGVGPGARVGLCRDRSVAMVVGALGTLYAGAAYVGLDPAYPPARLEYMVRDADVSVLLADPSATARLDLPGVTVIDPDAVIGAVPEVAPPVDRVSADDVAYVIYTSGSTGEPKGVQVAHRNLGSLIDWHHDAFRVTARDRASVLASPAFDASVWEVWPYLAAGASLHIPPHAVATTTCALRDWLVATGITIAFVSTPLLETLLGVDWPGDCALRTVLTGGDVLRRRPPRDLPFTVINNYGVAEATVVSTSGPVGPEDGTGRPPSIGRPVTGTYLRVLDERGHPVPTGEAGELYIGGASVAIGYLNRPVTTAERFVADPFHPEPGARLYRTGDVVRLAPDGDVHFLGRLDHQVQVRGQRVELDEVAAALVTHPVIGQCVVIADEHGEDEPRLVAYLVADGGPAPERAELRDHLAAWLPRHMIPTAFVALDALPVTANGKIDRDALPEPPRRQRHRAEGRPHDVASIEATVLAILEDLLELDHVHGDDDFFELGGHSLMGAQLVARLEIHFDVEIDLMTIFDHPTAADIALVVRDEIVAEERERAHEVPEAATG